MVNLNKRLISFITIYYYFFYFSIQNTYYKVKFLFQKQDLVKFFLVSGSRNIGNAFHVNHVYRGIVFVFTGDKS